MPQPENHERVMSISREEFLRVLPNVMGPDDYLHIEANHIRLMIDGAEIDISLLPQPEFSIAALRLPCLQVRITLPTSHSNGFMLRFDRVFQRGGG